MLTACEQHECHDFQDFLANDLAKELLRFTTAGSVDDGKSTLIGRLLHDSKAVYEDQLAALRKSRINRSGKAIDFALLTDGLRAEREQGITIDVAYRYFSTPRRKFIIADTPGHEQYTRNMATGASTADLAIVLVDATKGLLQQTRRHTYIASLLGIPNVVAAINKMDLAAYRADVFLALEREFFELARSLHIPHIQSIPISALEGDNVVSRSANMSWYLGPTLIEHLEEAEIRRQAASEPIRFPIQSVIRPDASFRGFAGRVSSGVIRPGQILLSLPSRRRTQVQAIVSYDGNLDFAVPSQSVTLKLADEIDLSRGDILVSIESPPHPSKRLVATLVWFHEEPLAVGRTYLLKHAGRQVKARIRDIRYRMNINELTREPAHLFETNDIGSVELETSSLLFVDPYSLNKTTGSFILIDLLSNATVAAGMIAGESFESGEHRSIDQPASARPSSVVAPEERHAKHGHLPAIIYVGQEERLAKVLDRKIFDNGFETICIHADALEDSAASGFLSASWSAGFVTLYSGTNFSPKRRALCESIARAHFFDASADRLESDPDLLGRVLDFARTLRILDSSNSAGDELND